MFYVMLHLFDVMVDVNVGLHLNGFQPYKEILMYQACKKTDFTVDLIWWGSPQLELTLGLVNLHIQSFFSGSFGSSSAIINNTSDCSIRECWSILLALV